MKYYMFAMMLVAFIATGCATPPAPVAANANTAVSNGLAVKIELDNTDVAVGDKIMIKLTARNMTGKPMRIKAPTSAPYIISVWRNTDLAWERVRTYPEAAMMVISPWTLDANSTRTFFVRVPVEPDWPTNELLRLSCELNSRPAAAPFVVITVSRPGETKE